MNWFPIIGGVIIGFIAQIALNLIQTCILVCNWLFDKLNHISYREAFSTWNCLDTHSFLFHPWTSFLRTLMRWHEGTVCCSINVMHPIAFVLIDDVVHAMLNAQFNLFMSGYFCGSSITKTIISWDLLAFILSSVFRLINFFFLSMESLIYHTIILAFTATPSIHSSLASIWYQSQEQRCNETQKEFFQPIDIERLKT